MPILTAIDLTGIQRFIFRSNRLKDVPPSSDLVSNFTSAAEGGMIHSIVGGSGQILMAAGGNAILEFPDSNAARSFAGKYSRRLIETAPDLGVAVAHVEYEKHHIAQAVKNVRERIELAKRVRRPSAPLLGISVNASCTETGLPAIRPSNKQALEAELLSRSIHSVRQYAQSTARETPNQKWPDISWPASFKFPRDLDDLGRSPGHCSLVGVVHIDGNGVGHKITQWLERQVDAQARGKTTDAQFRHSYAAWSSALEELSADALNSGMQALAQALRQEKGHWVVHSPSCCDTDAHDLVFQKDKASGSSFLPVRPILVGGDDLTFVCDGRIALSLADCILDAFERTEIPELGRMAACAGVALVPAHSPFSRAYELAEKLCHSAKGLSRAHQGGSALDWHIGAITSGDSLAVIRDAGYQRATFRLTCRPYLLKSDGSGYLSWRWLENELLGSVASGLRGEAWSKAHNKVRQLQDIASDGPAAIAIALKNWRIVHRDLQLPAEIAIDGFIGSDSKRSTPLLDAVELFNLHIDLKKIQSKEAAHA